MRAGEGNSPPWASTCQTEQRSITDLPFEPVSLRPTCGTIIKVKGARGRGGGRHTRRSEAHFDICSSCQHPFSAIYGPTQTGGKARPAAAGHEIIVCRGRYATRCSSPKERKKVVFSVRTSSLLLSLCRDDQSLKINRTLRSARWHSVNLFVSVETKAQIAPLKFQPQRQRGSDEPLYHFNGVFLVSELCLGFPSLVYGLSCLIVYW